MCWYSFYYCKIYVLFYFPFSVFSPTQEFTQVFHLMFYFCHILTRTKFETLGSNSSMNEDSSLIGCYTMEVGKHLLMCESTVVSSLSWTT